MADTTIIIALAGGAAAGAVLGWWFARQGAGRTMAEREAAVRAEGAAAEARAREEHGRERLELSTRLATAEANASSLAARVPELQRELGERDGLLAELRAEKSAAEARLATLEAQGAKDRQQAAEKLALLQDAQQQLVLQFESLSSQALQRNNAAFLDLARTQLGEFQQKAAGELAQKQQAIGELLQPVREALARVDSQISEMEKTRAGAYEGLLAQVRSLGEAQQLLRGETGRLASALRSTGARGRWGEIQLRRVVELAGMQSHCDFYEQQSVEGESGRLRPDMLVRMPGGKTIVVDAKVPFSAYDRATSATDDATRTAAYREHAVAVREHIRALAGRGYAEQFDEAPEFVVLFLPAETFFGAAVEHDPELIEFSAERNVMLTTPTTLIALLRAVHYGWRQEKLAENAKRISDLGYELYKRLGTMGEHVARLGKSLEGAVTAYNRAVGSLEGMVLPQARKFRDLHAAPEKEIGVLEEIEVRARELQAGELKAEPGAAGAKDTKAIEEVSEAERSTSNVPRPTSNVVAAKENEETADAPAAG